MKLLAFDTSTAQMSVAVCHGARLWQHSGAGGAQASATLVPTCMGLLAQAGLALHALDAIVFGAGPGSFTGLRTACAVAQGLGLGTGALRDGDAQTLAPHGVPLLPVNTLLAVAEEARWLWQQGAGAAQPALTGVASSAGAAPARPGGPWTATGGAGSSAPLHVLALLDARMGEVYHAVCLWQPASDGGLCAAADTVGRRGKTAPADACAAPPGHWRVLSGPAVSPPEAVLLPACTEAQPWLLAGNAWAVYGTRLAACAGAAAAAHARSAPGHDRVVSTDSFGRHLVSALPTAAALLRLAPALLAAGQAVPAHAAQPIYIRDKVAQTTTEREAARHPHTGAAQP